MYEEGFKLSNVSTRGSTNSLTKNGAGKSSDAKKTLKVSRSMRSASEDMTEPEVMLAEIPTNKAQRDECYKLVLSLSKELALLHSLSVGLGSFSDSDRLREEVRQCRLRAGVLANQTKVNLLKIFRICSHGEHRHEVERLCLLYTECLEFFLTQLQRVQSLLSMFPLHGDTYCLINTGIVDPLSIVAKHPCHIRDSACLKLTEDPDQSRKGEITRLDSDIADIRQLLLSVSSTVEVNPWDAINPSESTLKHLIDAGASRTDQLSRNNSDVSTQRMSFKRRRRMVSVVVVVVVAVIGILSVIVGFTLAFTND